MVHVPCNTRTAVDEPTIIHVITHPIIVLINTLQLIPSQVLVFSSAATPTVAPT